jgi:PPOX class probable F420-dependent enzyme
MNTVKIPESHADLFTKKTFAHLATIDPEGFPHVSPMWIDRDGDMILLNTTRDRVKSRNISKNTKIGLSLIDPDDPYRYMAVEGVVTEVREQGAEEHVHKLSQRYLGQRYPRLQANDPRVIWVIRPTHVKVQG